MRRFRPCAFGFTALCLSIFLWSTAYKFSLYNFHQGHSSRMYTARMWVETRSARAVSDVLRRVATEWPPATSDLNATLHRAVPVDLGLVENDATQPAWPQAFVSLIPARSPPLRRFCLA